MPSRSSPVNLMISSEPRQLPAKHTKHAKQREQEQADLPEAGRILTPSSERRIHPAAPVPLARLPDESGVPVGVATRLGGGAEMRRRKRSVLVFSRLAAIGPLECFSNAQ